LKLQKISDAIGVGIRKLNSGLKLWQRLGAWELSQDSKPRVYCNIVMSPQELRQEENRHQDLYPLLDYFMRHYEHLFDGWIQLDIDKDSKRLKLSSKEFKQCLDRLSDLSIIKLYKLEPGQMISFIQNRISNKYLQPYKSKYKSLKKMSQDRWSGVDSLIETDGCRMNNILRYFGESTDMQCSACDNCTNDDSPTTEAKAELRQQRINEHKGLDWT